MLEINAVPVYLWVFGFEIVNEDIVVVDAAVLKLPIALLQFVK